MKCEKIQEKLTSYLLGDLDGAESSAVVEHVGKCEKCRTELENLKRTVETLNEVFSADSPGNLRPEQYSQVLKALPAEKKKEKKRSPVIMGPVEWFRTGHPKLAAAAAVLIVTFILVAMLLPAGLSSRKMARVSLDSVRRSMSGAAEELGGDVAYDADFNGTLSVEELEPEEVTAVVHYGGVATKGGRSAPLPPPEQVVKNSADALNLNKAVPEKSRKRGSEPPDPIEYWGEGEDDFGDLGGGGELSADMPIGPEEGFAPKPTKYDTVAEIKSPITFDGIYTGANPGHRGSIFGKRGVGAEQASKDEISEDKSKSAVLENSLKPVKEIDVGGVVDETYRDSDRDGDIFGDAYCYKEVDTETDDSINGTPLVGDIPITGHLFEKKDVDKKKEESRTRIVEKGESLSRIALEQGVTVDEIARLNNISDPDLIRAGQSLRLPASSTEVKGKPASTPAKPKRETPAESKKSNARKEKRRVPAAGSGTDGIIDKLDKIKIPEIDFREAKIDDVVAFLRDATEEYDPSTVPTEAKGVNMMLHLDQAGSTSAHGSDSDDIFGFAADEEAGVDAESSVPNVTFSAKHITAREALNLVTEVSGLKYRVEDNTVKIVPKDAPDGEIVTKMYPVLPSAMQRMKDIRATAESAGNDIFGGGEGALSCDSEYREQDWVSFFNELGVSFPDGASIRYLPSIGKICVENTTGNLDDFEKVISDLNLIPSQVEIELQFVEFDKSDIEVLNSKGIIDVKSLQRLRQQGKGKLIAAPRVVTQPGMEAVVKGVTECIYPTELDFVESAQTNTVISGSATNALVPASFERRDVGSILVVIPDVAEDGSMINLSLTPELVLEPEWKKYEAKLSKAAGDEKVELEQPFFHAHSLQTTVSMYNGSTIILGGGAEGKDKDKLIYNFLTARLVDPSGEPIHEQDDFEEDEFIDEEQDEFIDDIDQLEEEESQEEVEEEEILEPEPEKEEVKEKEEDYNGPRFRAVGVNPFYAALDNPFSTFSIDVDTASYTMARNYMQRGYLPPAESVRTEEFVNFFDYAYKPPIGSTFKIYTECADSKFGRGLQMLKIGVKGRRIGREEQQGAILTFVVDTSGSMGTPNRLGLVKKSLRMLVENLSPSDMVAIIQFGADARIVMEHTPVSEKEQILGAIDKLQAEGFTNLENAMDLAFERAARVFKSGASNRILLCSDGAANMGADAAETILGRVEAYSKQGIYCSVFGFGIGSYNDEILEALADKGDGVYAFIDSEDEARRLFVDDMSATLNTIAKDVKIQVEFNPDAVAKYRQLGYENRQLTKEQFRDDTVDAGEVGSGQSVTALYELEMKPEAMGRKKMYGDYIAVVRVRYQRVDNGRIEEIEHTIWPRDIMGSFDDMDVRFRLAAAVAEFAEILRASPYAAGSGYQDVAEVLYGVSSELGLDKQIQELKRMVEGAGGMARGNF